MVYKTEAGRRWIIALFSWTTGYIYRYSVLCIIYNHPLFDLSLFHMQPGIIAGDEVKYNHGYIMSLFQLKFNCRSQYFVLFAMLSRSLMTSLVAGRLVVACVYSLHDCLQCRALLWACDVIFCIFHPLLCVFLVMLGFLFFSPHTQDARFLHLTIAAKTHKHTLLQKPQYGVRHLAGHTRTHIPPLTQHIL